jgi:glycosyltransferase involved in cell wall biosynthesis
VRVAHVAGTKQRVGGTEAYLLDLVRAQQLRGDDVAVFAADEGPVDLGTFAPDLVHLHGTPVSRDADEELQRRYRVVRSLHDYSFMCASGERWFAGGEICNRRHGPGCLVNFVARGCTHRLDLRAPVRNYFEIGRRLPAVEASDEVVVYSDYVRQQALHQGLRAERCHAIPYFVDRPSMPPAPSYARNVLFAGRVVKRKGLDVLLEALALTPESWETLIVAGDGWDLHRSRALATELGLEARVDWRGWTDTATALADAAVLAVPSRWPEPFGIVGIEAMAAGRAVVASDVGGVREWLTDGETGLLVPPGDAPALAAALERALDLAPVLGASGWERAAAFSTARHLDELDAVYRGSPT